MQNDYIINYETGEVKNVGDIRRLKDIENLDEVEEIGDNIILSSSDSLAVEEGLILNIDSSVIDEDVANEQEALQERLGEGVELVNFDYNNESGLTPTSFNFDGVNDYMKVPCDDSLMYHTDGTAYMGTDEETGEEKQLTKKEVLAQNGFTFEFYGIFEKGKNYWKDKEYVAGYSGLLGMWNGDEKIQAGLRFGLTSGGKQVVWNISDGGLVTVPSDFGEDWNQRFHFGYSLFDGKPHFLSVTLDPTKIYKRDQNGNHYEQVICLDGEEKARGGYSQIYWDYFCDNLLPELSCFCIGRCSYEHNYAWHYTKLDVYTSRIYCRNLTKEETRDNYITSVVYHQFLEKLDK